MDSKESNKQSYRDKYSEKNGNLHKMGDKKSPLN